MKLALDTETTGVDLNHICRPFLVTICFDDSSQLYYEWDVDPLTRKVNVVPSDLKEIVQYLEDAEELVFQNAKFDIRALVVSGLKWKERWWNKVHDTLYSGHLLASGESHDLMSMALRYLRVNILPLEEALGEACKEARRIVERKYPNWRIAREGDPDLPSLKGEKLWKWDYWLPKKVAEEEHYPDDHPWKTVTANYANGDSGVTLLLYNEHQRLIKERGLGRMYEERRKLIRIIYEMESRGVSCNLKRLEEMEYQFRAESKECERVCVAVSGGKLTEVGKGTTKAMREVMLKDFNLKPLFFSEKTNEPSIDAETLEYWGHKTIPGSRANRFVTSLAKKRNCDTDLGFLESYKRFGIPIGPVPAVDSLLATPELQREIRRNATDWLRIHYSINVTGSRTLRFSSSNPNSQNISKRKDRNLRYCFGPPPGYEWWALDYENIELRIPAYEAGEEEMIALFERPNDPPYYGSQHLLIAHILWPKEFEECLRAGESFKDKYKSTLYQWTKNGDFAVQYGAMEESGTADAAYHQEGAQAKVKARFTRIEIHNQQCIEFANEHGYINTMEFKGIGAYPIQTPRTFRGKVKPTLPLNYRTQGTAMLAMVRAMIRCQDCINENRSWKATIVLQIHDELVFQFPKGKTPHENLPKVLILKELMEESGRDIGIPLKVDYSYHPYNWAQSEETE